MKFRKKPVEIEAMRFNPTDPEQTFQLVLWLEGNRVQVDQDKSRLDELVIGTLEDGSQAQVKHVATAGDWIIRGVQGEFYPCKPDIFEATYDPVS